VECTAEHWTRDCCFQRLLPQWVPPRRRSYGGVTESAAPLNWGRSAGR
jgi:hypothetical protein